jgi:hypothetical protein
MTVAWMFRVDVNIKDIRAAQCTSRTGNDAR